VVNRLYTNGTDRWLTPPELVNALGQFDLDPCCEPWMPWRTAKRMLSLPPWPDSIVPGHPDFTDEFQASEIADGLVEQWRGRVFMNHPYSCALPWARTMIAHGDGIALTAAKSSDTVWGQAFLESFDLALYLAGRLLCHYPSGERSTGKWLPNVLWAFGERNCEALHKLHREAWPGVLVKREER